MGLIIDLTDIKHKNSETSTWRLYFTLRRRFLPPLTCAGFGIPRGARKVGGEANWFHPSLRGQRRRFFSMSPSVPFSHSAYGDQAVRQPFPSSSPPRCYIHLRGRKTQLSLDSCIKSSSGITLRVFKRLKRCRNIRCLNYLPTVYDLQGKAN